MPFDGATLAQIRSWVGSEPSNDDLAVRFERLGSTNLTALEVLRERRANLLADPAKVSVDGDASWDWSKNLEVLDKQVAELETVAGIAGPGTVNVGRLVRTGRR